jgi:UDP:flavonoid glycosyltransferase YjiC (YdhE family)
LVWDPCEGDLDAPAGDEPLVFLSASTVPGRSHGLLEIALRSLRGVRLVCTTLSAYDEPLPAWARVGPGRQQPLLDAATVMVSGAGNGIVCKGLAAGLPMVLVPGWGDQKENAARAARIGAAIVVPPRKLDADRLQVSVERALADPGYTSSSRSAGEAAHLGADHAARVATKAISGVSRWL